MPSRTNHALLLFALLALTGCTAFWQMGAGKRTGVSSSLVDYLYPQGEEPPEQPAVIPQLNLPLRVGLAFVPSGYGSSADIGPAVKAQLLAEVKSKFVDREYIAHIEVIPDDYLRSARGFDGLEQVARLYRLDVMALVSYDQVSVSEDNKASVLYWTIVGAYLIEGTENEVQTFVDTAVFDVKSRNLLFRAPGTDRRASSSTAIESVEELRKSRESGFATAMQDMTANLVAALDDFEVRLEEEPELAEVSWEESAAGGGGSSAYLVLILLVAGLVPGLRTRGRASASSGPAASGR